MFIDLPGKPGRPTCSDVRGTSMKVEWTKPESDGGAEITNYILEHRTEGVVEWTQVKQKISKTEHIVTGKTDGLVQTW